MGRIRRAGKAHVPSAGGKRHRLVRQLDAGSSKDAPIAATAAFKPSLLWLLTWPAYGQLSGLRCVAVQGWAATLGSVASAATQDPFADSPAARELQKRLAVLEAKLQLAQGDEAQPQPSKLKSAMVRPITCGLVRRASTDACSCR